MNRNKKILVVATILILTMIGLGVAVYKYLQKPVELPSTELIFASTEDVEKAKKVFFGDKANNIPGKIVSCKKENLDQCIILKEIFDQLDPSNQFLPMCINLEILQNQLFNKLLQGIAVKLVINDSIDCLAIENAFIEYGALYKGKSKEAFVQYVKGKDTSIFSWFFYDDASFKFEVTF